MSRYHIAAGLMERIKNSLSRALVRLTPGTPEERSALVESLANAVHEAVKEHQQEADRGRKLKEMMQQYNKNMQEVGAEPS